MNIIILPSILIVFGGIGMASTLWLSSKVARHKQPVPRGHEWFSISPDLLESELATTIQNLLKGILKTILVWTIALYRKISREITIKQVLKKKIRTFLYDHTSEGVRHPSEFLNRVRHKEKRPLEKGE